MRPVPSRPEKASGPAPQERVSQEPAVVKEKESKRPAPEPRRERAAHPPREKKKRTLLPTYRGSEREESSAMSSSSSSSMGGSALGLAAATAVAFSGSLVIFSLCRAHLSHAAEEPASPGPLRPCLSSSEKRRRGGRTKRGKAEKRVRFAADVVDNEGAPRPTRSPAAAASSEAAAATCRGAAAESDDRMMPANREALYRGMLRDRSAHRVTCSY